MIHTDLQVVVTCQDKQQCDNKGREEEDCLHVNNAGFKHLTKNIFANVL